MKTLYLHNYLSIRILFLLAFIGLCFSVLWAQPASEEEARQLKIDSVIRVAQEQIKRGYYQQAEVQLNTLQTSPKFSPYFSNKQSRTIANLLKQIGTTARERQKIAQLLQASDTLAAEGKYQEALDVLAQIKDSPYASAQEKQMIASRYDEIAAELQTAPTQPRMPVVEPAQEEAVEALIPLVEQPVPADMTDQTTVGQTQVVDVEMEPMEMLPVVEEQQPAEEISFSSQPEQPNESLQSDQYIKVIKSKRERLRS